MKTKVHKIETAIVQFSIDDMTAIWTHTHQMTHTHTHTHTHTNTHTHTHIK